MIAVHTILVCHKNARCAAAHTRILGVVATLPIVAVRNLLLGVGNLLPFPVHLCRLDDDLCLHQHRIRVVDVASDRVEAGSLPRGIAAVAGSLHLCPLRRLLVQLGSLYVRRELFANGRFISSQLKLFSGRL